MGGVPGIILASGRGVQAASAGTTCLAYRMTDTAGADVPGIIQCEGGISSLCITIQDILVKRA